MDEMDIKLKSEWMSLFRAVDKEEIISEFLKYLKKEKKPLPSLFITIQQMLTTNKS